MCRRHGLSTRPTCEHSKCSRTLPGLHLNRICHQKRDSCTCPRGQKYPVLRDEDGDEVQSKRFPKVVLRDIPWLPEVFELQTPAWMVNLYMIFGATVRDMATRVHPDDEPRKTQQQLENRILKKSLDYRNRYGGFGHDIRPVKGNRVTENAKYLLLGNKAGRQPLSAYQLIYVSEVIFRRLQQNADPQSRELLGTVYPGSRKMSQSPNSTRYPLPKPQEVCTPDSRPTWKTWCQSSHHGAMRIVC